MRSPELGAFALLPPPALLTGSGRISIGV